MLWVESFVCIKAEAGNGSHLWSGNSYVITQWGPSDYGPPFCDLPCRYDAEIKDQLKEGIVAIVEKVHTSPWSPA